jgi:hypothetical protein
MNGPEKPGDIDDPVAQSIRNEQMQDAAPSPEEIREMTPKPGSLAEAFEQHRLGKSRERGRSPSDLFGAPLDEVKPNSTDEYTDLGAAAKEQGLEDGGDGE